MNTQIVSNGPPKEPPFNGPSEVLRLFKAVLPEFLPAIEALSLAGETLRSSVGSEVTVREKALGDYQSPVDLQVDALVHRVLEARCPDIPILSEESSARHPLDADKLWVVDPLDGTSSFLFRTNPQHPSVMAALLEHGSVVGSAVHLPLTGDWYTAVKGYGAYKNGQRLEADPNFTDLKGSWVVMNEYADVSNETPQFALMRRMFRSKDGVPVGLQTVEVPHSSAACRVVDPDSQVMLVVHDNNPKAVKQAVWDLAAPKLLVEEAGGVFWDLEGTPYDLKTGQGPILVAHSESVARLVLTCLKERSGGEV